MKSLGVLKVSPRADEIKIFILFFGLLLLSLFSNAYDGKQLPNNSDQSPKELEGVGIEQKLGSSIDLNLQFKNENNEDVRLATFFDGKHPVILSLVYYSCPGLCNFHLNGLVDGLKGLDWSSGDKFSVLAVSFDPEEKSDLASSKKKSYMKLYARDGGEKGWHFLTADVDTIKKLTDSVGFKYKWNEKDKEWSHASAAIILTPTGIISRYLGGIFFESKDIKLALNEAASGKIGSFFDKVLLYCFHYDPQANKYALYAYNLVKMGGALIILIMFVWLLPFWLKAKKEEGTVRS